MFGEKMTVMIRGEIWIKRSQQGFSGYKDLLGLCVHFYVYSYLAPYQSVILIGHKRLMLIIFWLLAEDRVIYVYHPPR